MADRYWDDEGYRRIRSVAADDGLTVEFANGDRIRVAIDRLVHPGRLGANEVVVSHEDDEVVLSVDGEPHEVSWMDLRAQSDPDFKAHLVDEADAEARRIGQSLKALRLRREMTARQVASAAEIAPMSLSRIERGEHDVVYRTLRRLLAAMDSSLGELSETAQTLERPELLVNRLRSLGVSQAIVEQWRRATGSNSVALARVAEKVFGWTPADLASGLQLDPRGTAALVGRYKSQVNQQPELATYAFWAHWLASIIDHAAPRSVAEVPENPLVIREEIMDARGAVDFAGVLQWAWDHGVAVVPLRDPGEFHGACWTFGNRAVVVLKQRTSGHSRWAFDLAHELAHLGRHIDERKPEHVELWDPMSENATADDDEQEANDFAGVVLLGDADALAEELVVRTGGNIARLKQEVSQLAHERGVSQGSLANYMAYRLSLDGEAWWGSAANLQESDYDAPDIASEQLLRHLDWEKLTVEDAALIAAALDWRSQ